MANTRLNATVLYVGAVRFANRAKLAREAAIKSGSGVKAGSARANVSAVPVGTRRGQTWIKAKSVSSGDPYSKAWATRLAKYGPAGVANGRHKVK